MYALGTRPLAHDAAGNYLVAFMCDEWPDQFAICTQPVSSSGALNGDVVKVHGASTNSGAPDLAYYPQRDEYLIVWGEDYGGNCDWIYTQRVAPDGSARGARGGFSACLDGPYGPHVAYQPLTQQYVVVWTYNAVDDWDAAGRLIEADGTLLGGTFQLEATLENQTDVTLSRQGPDGDLLVVYGDDRTGTADIYGERYRPPLPSFTATPGSGLAPLTVVFTDTSTAPNGSSGWAWDFGDTGTSSVQHPTHTYTALGTYGVTLTLYSNTGAGRTTRSVTVTTPVGAQFSATPITGTRPTTVTFSDLSTSNSGAITSWWWDFGDGYTSTQQNPIHFYALPGVYDVTLTASTGTYSDTERKQDYIIIGPQHRAVINYTYDGLYRLTKANSTGAMTTTFEYAYDPVGNRTAQTATITSTVVTAYQYDAANRLASVNGQAYTWDDNGNLVNDGAKTYTYNQANRLTDLTQGATTFQFNYNGDGARLRQIIAGVSTTYTQDLVAPLPVVLQAKTGANTTKYVYALGTRPLAHAERGTAWEYLLADALGSVRQIVDADGNVTLAESYEPYGNVLSSTGTASSIFAYAGEQLDTYIKLLFLRARYYSPETGGFLSKDVWQGDYTRPQSFNGWSYVEGNPINWTDPTGQSPEWPPTELLSVQVLRPNILESAARHNTSLTNMDNNSFAALMAAILHWEGRLFGNLKPADQQRRDRWGDYAFIATGWDATTGIANIRPSVALEVLQAGYVIKGGRDYKTVLWLAALPDINTGNYLYARGGDSCDKLFNAIFYDLQDMNISIEYLAANLQRGADQLPD